MLTHHDMQEVEAIFLQSLDLSMGRYIEEARVKTVQEFILRLTYDFKPAWIMSPSGIGNIINYVFQSEIHTDFIQTLTFNFLSRWAGAAERYEMLIDALSMAVSVDKAGNDSATPGVYSARLTTKEDVFTTLRSNKWLTTILLIILYVDFRGANDKKR